MLEKLDNKKILKSSRARRLVSSTCILLGLVTFLLFTWKDYSEQGLSTRFLNELDAASTVSPSITVTKPMVTNKELLKDLSVSRNEEIKINSKKVEEQISTIRSEVYTEKASSPTNLPVKNKFSPEYNFNEILNTSPVVLFIRSSQPQSQYLKNLLTKEYEISPQLAVVDLDQHSNGDRLEDYIRLNKLTSSPTSNNVPYLFINSVSVINDNINKDIRKLHSDGSLLQKFRHLGNGKILFEKMGLPSNS